VLQGYLEAPDWAYYLTDGAGLAELLGGAERGSQCT
jgi:hypothetical protein